MAIAKWQHSRKNCVPFGCLESQEDVSNALPALSTLGNGSEDSSGVDQSFCAFLRACFLSNRRVSQPITLEHLNEWVWHAAVELVFRCVAGMRVRARLASCPSWAAHNMEALQRPLVSARGDRAFKLTHCCSYSSFDSASSSLGAETLSPEDSPPPCRVSLPIIVDALDFFEGRLKHIQY